MVSTMSQHLTYEKVLLKRESKKKLSTLYHGLYRVLDTSEHSMLIFKNNRVEKVSTWEREKLLLIMQRVQIVRISFIVKSSKIKYSRSFQINMSFSGFNHLKVRFLRKS